MTQQFSKKNFPDLVDVNIARISTVPYFVVTQLKNQIDAITKAGGKVTIVTSDGPELVKIDSNEIVIKIIEIPRSIRPLKDLLALVKLVNFFRTNRFKIIHSTTPKAGLLCAIAGFLSYVPIRLHTFTGQPWIELNGPLRWISMSADYIIGKLSTKCYADSQSQRDFLVNTHLISPSKINVIGEGSLAGVDMERFNIHRLPESKKSALKIKLGIKESTRVILFVGRVTRDKGVGELFKAFDILVREGYDIALLLVGPLDSEHAEEPEFGADVISLMKNVYHVGYSENPENYMAISNLLCLPSYREGFGTVVIEAAAMKLPTVGTAIYGLSDAVKNDETGKLVPPKDTLALANALREMLDNPELVLKMGLAAYDRCKNNFDAIKINTLLLQEYASLISQHQLK